METGQKNIDNSLVHVKHLATGPTVLTMIGQVMALMLRKVAEGYAKLVLLLHQRGQELDGTRVQVATSILRRARAKLSERR